MGRGEATRLLAEHRDDHPPDDGREAERRGSRRPPHLTPPAKHGARRPFATFSMAMSAHSPGTRATWTGS